MKRGISLRLLVGGFAASAIVGLASSPGFAAGSGYIPTTPPSKAAYAGFSAIVTAQSVPNSGGTVTGSANGGTCTVVVPSGTFPNGAVIVISTAAPSSINAGSGTTVVIAFSVIAVDPNSGQVIGGTFSPPLTVTITDSSITSSDQVVNVTAPGSASTVPGAQVSQGQAVVSVSSDPNFAVVAPPTTTATVSSGQLAFTGPGAGFTVLASAGGGLLVVGLVGLVAAARRRTAGAPPAG